MRVLPRPLTHGWCLIAAALACLGPAANPVHATKPPATRATSLRLVARIDGRDYTHFRIKNAQLTVLDESEAEAPAGRKAWRLDGDLAANAPLFRFSPSYVVEKRDPLAGPPSDDAHVFDAIVGISSNDAVFDWGRGTTIHGLIVFVWLVDGRATDVVPVPLPNDPDAWGRIGAVFSLSEATRRGAPAVLLWTQRGFAKPGPMFRDAKASAALAAMHFATPEAVRAAIAALPDPRVKARTADVTLLHVAAEGGFTAAVEALLDRKVPAGPGREGDRPIDWAVRTGRTEIATLLAARGGWGRQAEADALRDAAGRAARFGHLDLAAEFYDRAGAWSKSSQVAEALADRAAGDGRIDILERLATQGPATNLHKISARSLIARIHAGDFSTARFIIEHEGAFRDEFEQATPLHAAARRGWTEGVSLLLAGKSRVDAPDLEGRTPLMFAARNGHSEICRALLAAGADPARADVRGMTALHFAVMGADPATTTVLLDQRANPAARDADGRTALDLALHLRTASCVDLLARRNAEFSVASEASLEGAVALDRDDLLERALAAGWNPAKPLAGGWSIQTVAKQLGSDSIQAWIARLPSPPTSTAATPAKDAESLPAVYAPPASEWLAGGYPRRAQAVEARMLCTFDSDGTPRFPRTIDPVPDDVAAALHASIASWSADPATQGGRAVPVRATVTCVLPASDSRVYEVDEIDTPPVKIGGDHVPVRIREETRVTGYRTYPANSVNPAARGLPAGTITIPEAETTALPPVLNEILVVVVVEPDGSVSDISVVHESTDAPEPEQLVLSWRFKPGRRDGVAVRTRMILRSASFYN